MKVAVIYDTSFGHTEVIAKKIAEGVASQNLEAKLFAVKEINEKPEILADPVRGRRSDPIPAVRPWGRARAVTPPG